MPDLVNPEQTGGEKTYIIWKDELCISCLNQGSCSLLQVMHHCTILTYSGMHVANCDDYKPNKESEYYLELDADFEDVKRVNFEALQQQMDLLKEKMGKLNVIPQ